MFAVSGAAAQAGAWHLDSRFGKHGVAGLPVREGGYEREGQPGPGDDGSLLAPGPQESVFVGGYAHSKKGAFLVARLSRAGTLIKSFGDGGLTTVPAIYSLPESPPRMFALAGGKLLIVGLNRARQLVVVRLSARGRPDRTFGHDGVAQYSLLGTHGHAIVAAASMEPDGDILAVYFHNEVPQPVNQPRITAGLGQEPIGFVRLLPSGALDSSFGQKGFLNVTGQPPATGELPACAATIAPDGSVLLAYEQAAAPNDVGAASPAVQELTPTGADASGFGDGGLASLSFTPVVEGVDSIFCGGLFALPDGEVEVSFGGAGELARFTTAGQPNLAFGSSGHSRSGSRVRELALASDGETLALHSVDPLTLAGTLSSGAPDAALGGIGGMRFGTSLPRARSGEEQPVVELLPSAASLYILVGESLIRLQNSRA